MLLKSPSCPSYSSSEHVRTEFPGLFDKARKSRKSEPWRILLTNLIPAQSAQCTLKIFSSVFAKDVQHCCSALLFSTAVAADCSQFITVPGRCIPLPVAQWQLSAFFWGGLSCWSQHSVLLTHDRCTCSQGGTCKRTSRHTAYKNCKRARIEKK